MKKEYDLSKMKRRPGKVKVYPEAAKTAISIRIDAMDVVALKTEAYRLGIPYQTFICSVLHRYVTGELVDLKSVDVAKLLKSKD
jgi:predicted DNA binding CopG/RHH family protein